MMQQPGELVNLIKTQVFAKLAHDYANHIMGFGEWSQDWNQTDVRA